MKTILFALLYAVTSLVPATGWKEEPGFGPSDQPFRQQAWQLPAGVILASKDIHEYSYCTEQHFLKKDIKGVPGGIFNVCFDLKNTTDASLTVQFPQDLLIQSNDVKYQNGLLMGLGEVKLQPGETRTIYANAFCLNEKRAVPGSYDAEGQLLSFRFGPGEVPSTLRQVTDIVRSKGLSAEFVTDRSGSRIDYKKMERIVWIQVAIWEITSGDGLHSETLSQLKAMKVI